LFLRQNGVDARLDRLSDFALRQLIDSHLAAGPSDMPWQEFLSVDQADLAMAVGDITSAPPRTPPAGDVLCLCPACSDER